MSDKRPVVAVDFAGVICDMTHILEGKKLGPPVHGALDALQDLYDAYYVIIHTTMANTPRGRQVVAEWLEFYDVDYHEIVGKPAAEYYIDDHGVKFNNWIDTRKKIGLE